MKDFDSPYFELEVNGNRVGVQFGLLAYQQVGHYLVTNGMKVEEDPILMPAIWLHPGYCQERFNKNQKAQLTIEDFTEVVKEAYKDLGKAYRLYTIINAANKTPGAIRMEKVMNMNSKLN